MTQYVAVVESDGYGEEPIELPTEDDGTLLLSSLEAQFPGATGLRYRPSPDAKALRGLRLVDGAIHPPPEGWEDFTFVCTLPKENKRKPDDNLENTSFKTQRMDGKNLCTDLIVLGLPWTTTDEELNKCFSQYGDLVMSQVKKDPKTGKSKGFGFIKFADYSVQQRVVGRRHIVEGRTCDVKLPNSKGEAAAQQFNSKVFIGRLTEYITNEDLMNHFSQFGEITDVYIPKPFRGFAFVTFLNPEIAQGLCGEDHIVKGTSLHVGNAIPKNHQGGGGGNGGARGNQGNFQGGSGWNQGGNNSGPPDMNSFNMQALAMPMLAALNQAGLGDMMAAMQQQGGNQGNYGGPNNGNNTYVNTSYGNNGYGNNGQGNSSHANTCPQSNPNNGSYGNASNNKSYGGSNSYGGGNSSYAGSSSYGGSNTGSYGNTGNNKYPNTGSTSGYGGGYSGSNRSGWV